MDLFKVTQSKAVFKLKDTLNSAGMSENMSCDVSQAIAVFMVELYNELNTPASERGYTK